MHSYARVNMESTLFFVLGILRFSLATENFHWGYHGDSGPSYWSQHFESCAGKWQSPIDIPREEDVEYAGHLGFVESYGYDDVRVHTLKNNGHSLQVDVSGDSYILGGGLPGLYKVTQLHFHWGRTSDRGSEHTFDGTAFPMEMHVVHYKKEYGSINEALNKSDGLAVLGFMFKVIPFDNVFYEKFLKKLSAVQYSGESTDTWPMRLTDILPNSWQNLKYFRYNGSLTTPPCTEAVIWTVFTRPIYISEKQLRQFRKLYSNEKSSETYEHISDNYRPVQPLNNRRVLKNVRFQLL
uniref:carbonic anhydrase n=1 Tax=Sinohyriopsis cumingii TaxID=165450 RepID=A0A3G2KWM0_SINCU|nr:carbonic anhydrase [Sinohyriopsis cumingii]